MHYAVHFDNTKSQPAGKLPLPYRAIRSFDTEMKAERFVSRKTGLTRKTGLNWCVVDQDTFNKMFSGRGVLA